MTKTTLWPPEVLTVSPLSVAFISIEERLDTVVFYNCIYIYIYIYRERERERERERAKSEDVFTVVFIVSVLQCISGTCLFLKFPMVKIVPVNDAV
jgi:amino acid transporter